jgi:autotransporter adhesin
VGGIYDTNGDGTNSLTGERANRANGWSAAAFGSGNWATASFAAAFGVNSTASAQYASAFGFQAQALNVGATAIGYQAVADRDYAVSVGSGGSERQIIHVAAGTADTDAVNKGQLDAAVAAAGGGNP